MKVGPLEVSRLEYAVWLGICEGKPQKRMASDTKRSLGGIRKARLSLARKLAISNRDTQAFVRAAASADLLKELPPLNAATSAPPTFSKEAAWTPCSQ